MSEARWAVLVGACRYEEGLGKLQYAAADAVDFRKAIVESLDFDPNRLLMLADPEDQDDLSDFTPTRNNIFKALGLVRDRSSDFYRTRGLPPMGEDDLFLFYFSGHGMRTEDGTEHLLGVDASRWSLRDTAVPLEAVVDCIEAIPCPHKVLFLDACRDEFFDDVGAKSGQGAKGIGEPSVVEREGLATFYSCDPQRRSYEIDDLKHGSFTYCLLEAIKHEDVNTLEELDEYLKSRVPTVNTDAGKAPQQPYAVPRPAEMMRLELFRVAQRDEEQEDLIAMTNHLYETKRIGFEMWDKLTGIWDAGTSPNIRLQKRLFREFYREGMSLEDFEARWRRTERPSLSGFSPRADVTKLPRPQ